MASRAGLKVVSENTQPPPSAPKTVRAAAEVSERALLVALRNKIASDIDKGVPAHALAPLSRQLRDIDREIRALDKAESGDEVGEAAETPDEEWTAT